MINSMDPDYRESWLVRWGLIIVLCMIVLAGGFVVVLSATKKPAKTSIEARFKWVPKKRAHDVVIVTDTETGIKYLVVSAHNDRGVSITPLLPKPKEQQ